MRARLLVSGGPSSEAVPERSHATDLNRAQGVSGSTMCSLPGWVGLHLHVYNPAADLFALLAGAFKCDLSLDVALRSGAICLQRTCPRDFADHQQCPLRGRDDRNHGSKGREPLSGIPAA